MRKLILLFIVLGALVNLSYAQDGGDDYEITIDNKSATYKKISDNNYTLTVRWSPMPGAVRYRIRFRENDIEVTDPMEELTEQFLTSGDSTSATLGLKNNIVLFQVLALDGAERVLGESCVYRATLSYDDAAMATKNPFPFLQAFWNSLRDLDPFAGWAIVVFIALLFVYGAGIAASINKQAKRQNHQMNEDLGRLVEEYLARWRANLTNPAQLKALLEEIGKQKEKDHYCILNILEKGLRNNIDNEGRDIVSEEVDRDMEKAIVFELENLRIGNYTKRKKHISLARVKMFGETAPMLGLLGTVSGLIVAFFNILGTANQGGNYQELLKQLSSGIYSAIVTTIIGLIVGIALLFIHHAVESNLKRLENAWHELYIKISEQIS